LAAHATAADPNEVTQLKTLMDEVPPVAGKPGHPRSKPEAGADRPWLQSEPLRERLWSQDIIPFLARRGEEHGSALGIYRYVVEQGFAFLKGFRRLRLRYERTAFMHQAALQLAICRIAFREL
jgi:transposase